MTIKNMGQEITISLPEVPSRVTAKELKATIEIWEIRARWAVSKDYGDGIKQCIKDLRQLTAKTREKGMEYGIDKEYLYDRLKQLRKEIEEIHNILT